MHSEFVGNDIIVKNIKCFNLPLTLDCGQAFRWEQQEDGSFCAVVRGVFLNIEQKEDDLIFKNTTKSDFENIWVPYFDLTKDYEQICTTLKKDPTIAKTVDEYYGIRILNQDPWEALCSFVISQQNNIKRIKLIISRLCTAYGNRLDCGEYTFPSARVLSKLSVEDFEKLGTGYRAKYLYRLAKDVQSGIIDLDKIKTLPTPQAREQLIKIYGVGEKVANCTLLFGMQKYDAFPVDVWIKRVMALYPDGLPECFKGIEGIAQQYLFHYARNNL